MIVIVDEDVWFAEELQEFLIHEGYNSVVISCPQGTSLLLMQAAQILIMDVLSGSATAQGVLETLRSRGSHPKVILMSGRGADVVAEAVRESTSLGFRIICGLEKGSLPAVLPDVLSRCYVPGPSVRRPTQENLEPSVTSRAVQLTSIVVGGSLKYIGARVQRNSGASFSGTEVGAARVDNVDRNARSPKTFVETSLSLQRALDREGHYGLLFTHVPEDIVQNTGYRVLMCGSHAWSSASLSRIVIELDLDQGADTERLYSAISELRSVGFGVLLRCAPGVLPSAAALAMLPITALEILQPHLRSQAELSDVMRRLRRHAVGSMCRVQNSTAGIEQSRRWGFSLLDTGSEGELTVGRLRVADPLISHH